MAETLLGFDFGTRRIGIAIGNTLTGSAHALEIVSTEPLAARWSAIAAMVARWAPQRLVVGRPLHADGTSLPVTRQCERFARQLTGRFGLPVELVDEGYSSAEARARIERGPVDAEAAAVILRQYLSSHRPEPSASR